MNFYIKTYGCQYNEWDAARLVFVLRKLGLAESDEKSADIIFLLNCSVRKSAVDRALGMAHNWEGRKVIAAGCILPKDKPKFEKRGVILWDGEDFEKLEKILGLKTGELPTPDHEPQTNLIPIMKGCNNFCSYCAVPYTRGREISRPIDEVIADVKNVIGLGHQEVWLLGQNVNSYEFGFARLLREINDIDGEFTVFFTSNHPKDMTDDIIEAIATLPKIGKTIHLPLQSGSNKILKAMNRPYTKEQYLALVEKMKRKIPNLKLTTDTIVGFPGETEEDFEETVKLIRKVDYFQAYNNKYSPREGTAAFKLGDPIPWSEKERRWRILNDLVYKRSVI